jgi:hypothetical protein
VATRRVLLLGNCAVAIVVCSSVCSEWALAQGTGGKGCYFGECGETPGHRTPSPLPPEYDRPDPYPTPLPLPRDYDRPDPYPTPSPDYPQQQMRTILAQCHVGPRNIHLDITPDGTVYSGPGLIRPVATAVETGVPMCPVVIYDAVSGISFCIVNSLLLTPSGPIGNCWPCPSPQCH